jgi:hypothetical protein
MNKVNENDAQNIVYPYYTLKKRAIVRTTGLFKLRNYDDNHIIFTGS